MLRKRRNEKRRRREQQGHGGCRCDQRERRALTATVENSGRNMHHRIIAVTGAVRFGGRLLIDAVGQIGGQAHHSQRARFRDSFWEIAEARPQRVVMERRRAGRHAFFSSLL